MIFEWDDAKNASNVRKHGIAFKEAIHIFSGPVLTEPSKGKDYGEERQISIGIIEEIIAVAVVHTQREEHTRIISARRASREESARYHALIQGK